MPRMRNSASVFDDGLVTSPRNTTLPSGRISASIQSQMPVYGSVAISRRIFAVRSMLPLVAGGLASVNPALMTTANTTAAMVLVLIMLHLLMHLCFCICPFYVDAFGSGWAELR